MHVYEVKTGKELRAFGDDSLDAGSMALSSDGKRLLTNEYGRRSNTKTHVLRCCDPADGKEVWKHDLPRDNPITQPVAISPDGRRFAVATAAESREILIGDLSTGKFIQSIKTAVHPRCLTFSPDGRSW